MQSFDPGYHLIELSCLPFLMTTKAIQQYFKVEARNLIKLIKELEKKHF
jgi:hypothetical protein